MEGVHQGMSGATSGNTDKKSLSQPKEGREKPCPFPRSKGGGLGGMVLGNGPSIVEPRRYNGRNLTTRNAGGGRILRVFDFRREGGGHLRKNGYSEGGEVLILVCLKKETSLWNTRAARSNGGGFDFRLFEEEVEKGKGKTDLGRRLFLSSSWGCPVSGRKGDPRRGRKKEMGEGKRSQEESLWPFVLVPGKARFRRGSSRLTTDRLKESPAMVFQGNYWPIRQGPRRGKPEENHQ